MKFTLSWLKRFLDTNANLAKITHKLTMIGLEVEDVEDHSTSLADFEVAEIISAEKHPDANKLQICKVRTLSEELQIICGAPNAKAGIKVVLAKVGTLIPNGNFKIKKANIRGVESCGMMCSEDELGIGKDSSGIIELTSDAVIGKSALEYLGLDDPVIHINITPNRADALGVYGIARDLSAAGLGTLKTLEMPSIKGDFTTNCQLQIKDTKACSFFSIREIKNLNKCESPKWLQHYLQNIGVGSISPLVDVTNYISYSFGQPMHAYDADKIGDSLVIETLESDASFHALNDKDYTLKQGDLVIGNKKEIHCLAGIIGGKNSACNSNTKRIILEAAHFNADHIAKTGRNIQIETDSRYRFERNVDKEFTLKALDIATQLIIAICGGEVSNTTSYGDSTLPERTIDFPVDFLKSRTNMKLPAQDISELLSKLGFICNVQEESINITIPSWRYDVSIKEDIVEEIVRIYGYDKLPETPLPHINQSRIIPKDQKLVSDIKRILASAGLTETVSWSFTDSKKAKYFTNELKDELTLLNPISSDLNYMRPSILPNLISFASNNINRSLHDLSMFEVGPIFENDDEKVIVSASGIRTGFNISQNSYENRRKFDVFDAKSDVVEILNHAGLSIDKYKIANDAPSYYHPTRSASIYLGKNLLGHFGQIHPSILKEFDISTDIVAFEILISNLPVGKNKYGKKPSFITSNYQMITRDYAFIVEDNQPVGELLACIRNIDKKLIRSVKLFDIYSGDKIEHGKKSIALSVNIQDDNKTLSEDDISSLHASIIKGVTEKFGATLRDQ
ncbi:phenylalanine--tRNA ligase subunit beta [Rickettsiaceae bacterium]|nr:phenylalanine--tRNA ligase subunit beta [Rickettsiaceae bacterium]